MIVRAAAGDDAATQARRGGREWLSLALLEARNELLARLALLTHERAGPSHAAPAEAPTRAPASGRVRPAPSEAPRLAARAGWFQEWWLARHVQRARGEAADATSPRLPGIEPRAEGWLRRAEAEDADAIRAYLGRTLEQTLDLLGHAEDDDAGLYFFRLALQHEDRLSERLGHLLMPLLPPPRAMREPLGVPAQRWWLGSAAAPEGDPARAGGFVPHGERWAHEVAVPEFEIDAQCVNWAQYAEFAEDGGYDRRECWSEAGWAWLHEDGRRAPRDVEQLAGSVLVARAGQLQRAPAQQAAMQVTRHEAEAWCRWAGRRLPTEPEWELAAHAAARRGFAWGDVLEWVAGSARLFPGAGARVPPGTLDVIAPVIDAVVRGGGATAASGTAAAGGVLRGCTSATPARWRHPKARRFALPHDDRQRSGFRSCAL
ncbi:MAG: SUMF1/EgtB/PvdO family nonheme iron enzyme [Burkholderiales bacterium]|nr:SUMF1/EgtB/PvdO family nonheme iron enzyme [Burkholderiales bacterium]